MAAAADHHPRASSTVLNSPKPTRAPAARGAPSPPCTTRVRNSESESDSIVNSSSSYAPSPSSPHALGPTDHCTSNPSTPKEEATDSSAMSFSAGDEASSFWPGDESGNAGKKPVWNKPSNGAVEVGGAVMGAVLWPALSESTNKGSPKPSNPSDSLKPLPEGSGSGIASSSQKQVVANDTNPSLGPNHAAPTRQKSMKRSGGSSGVTANGGFHGLVEPLGQVAEIPSDIAGLPGSPVPEASSRDHTQKGSGQRGGFGSQSRSGNDHPQQRNSYRRVNSTPNPRSDGSHHQNHGGRDRTSHDRNSHRSFNGRDSQMQTQRVVPPRGFMQHPPHGSTAFLPPPPMPIWPFGNPFYAEVAPPPPMFYVPVPTPPPDSLRGMPIVTPLPPPAMLFPPPDHVLHAKIVTQINYYFSNENLISDTFLRQNMDEEGWVPIKLIAGFKKVLLLTNDISLILDALRSSDVVEVQNGKVRKRNDWRKWIMSPSIEFHTVSSPRSVEHSTTHDTLTANIQSMSVVEKTNKQAPAETFLSRSHSGELNSPFEVSTEEGTCQAPIQAGTEISNFS